MESNGSLKTASILNYDSSETTYSIRVEARDDSNMSVEENFIITINDISINQSITFPTIANKSIGDFDFTPSASSNSGLPLTYTSSAPLIASIEGSTPGNQKIKIRGIGQVTITASQNGNSIYNPAPDVNRTFNIDYNNFFADSMPGLRFWFDGNDINADSTVDLESNGSSVIIWNDKATNNNNAVQGNTAIRPVYLSNELNGMGVLSFSEAQTLEITADSNIQSIAAVLRQSPNQLAQSKPFGGDQVLTTSNGMLGLGSIQTSISSSGNYRVIIWQFSPNNHSLHILGHAKGTNNNGATPAPFDSIGNDLAGNIAEIIAFDRPLNDGVRQKLEGYLAHKWGLANGLKGSHTYKMTKPNFGGIQNLNFQTLTDSQVGQSVNLVVTADSGLTAFSYDSNDTNVVSFSGNVATALAAGKVRITATQAGDSNWLSSNAYQDWNVTAAPKSNQSISFTPIPTKTTTSANFSLDANATSGLPVSFTSLSPHIATVDSNGTVTILGHGVATFRASQDGNVSFHAASAVDQNLTVTKTSQSISFNAIPNQNLSSGTCFLIGSSSSNLTLSYTSSDLSIATVNGNLVTFIQAGSVAITANQGGNHLYATATSTTQNLVIIDDTLQPQTISWTQNLSSLTYGSADINLTATSSSALPVIYTSSDSNIIDINGTYIKIKGAGVVTISASQTGNGQYQPAAPVDKNVTVNKANQTIVTNLGALTLPNITMDSGDFEFSPDIKSVKTGTISNTGLPLNFTSSVSNVIQVTGGGTRLKPVGGGTATITVSQAGNFGYDPASSKTFTVTVTEYSPYSNSLPGMTLWLDARDINGDQLPESAGDFINIGGQTKISSWADRSGSSNSLSQGNSAKMPSYTIENGMPSLIFDGVDDSLSNSLPTSLFGNPAFTVLMAVDATSNGRILHFGSSSGIADQVIGMNSSGAFTYNNGDLSPSSNMNGSTISVFRRQSGSLKSQGQYFRFGNDMSMLATNASGAPSIPSNGSTLILGNGIDASGNNHFFGGKINEVMIFSSALNDHAIRRLEGYLAHKWGVFGNLDVNHSYKNNRPQFGGIQSITLSSDNIPIDPSDNLPYMSIFDSPFNLDGSFSSSGLDLTYSTSNSSILSVQSDGRLKPVATGNVTVSISQPGDSHFSAAPTRTFSMKIVDKQTQVINFPPISDVLETDTVELNANSDSGLATTFTILSGSNIATLSGSNLSFSNIGTVSVRASQDGNAQYLAAVPVEQTFLVTRANSPPNDLNSTAPLTFSENQPIGSVVGEFNATDPDNNAILTFDMVSGTGDGNNSLFSLETNGSLKTAVPFDFESNASTYSIRVQVKDEDNASIENQFVIVLLNEVEDLDGDGIEDYYDSDDDGDGFSDLAEIAYGSNPRDSNSVANTSPSDLNSTTLLTIAENQPVGTIVGEFNATDPDNNAILTYHLVSGSGDGNNSLFVLETNGSLKTATIFNYESNASVYTIRVQVSDEYNATADSNFTVTLMDEAGNHSNKIYEFVEAEGISWTAAKVAADAANASNTEYFVYLATITSEAEYDTIMEGALSAGLGNFWLGANDSNEEGKWYWTEGPEGLANGGLGTLFWTDNENEYNPFSNTELGNLVEGFFHKWSQVAGFKDDTGDYLQWAIYPIYDYSTPSPIITSYGFNWVARAENPTMGGIARGYILEKEWIELVPSFAPTDLNSTAPLAFQENLPVGTFAGKFMATDSDVNATLSFYLVDGNGSTNNALFTLETNGSLKTAVPFDFESNASTYSIRVQVRDEDNASIENQFEIVLLNEVEDLDGDGIEDHYDSDDDGDGFSDLTEIAYGSNPRDSMSLANTPPIFKQNQSFSIAENEPPATWIGNISAYDPDNNQSIPVVMESPSSAFVYDMNQSVRSAQVFDYESNQTNYSLSFSAKDEFNSTTFHVIYIEVNNVIEDLDEDGFEDAFDSDIDGDGLENENEIIAGTDPINPDTDSDGLLDGEELILNTNPLNSDSDGDHLSDKTETLIGTNPLNSDTDKDGFSDKEEVIAFTSPEDANDFPGNSLRQSPNLGPDGKVYEVVKEPMSLKEARALAKAKGATLPYLDPTQIELNKFLTGLLLRNRIETKNYFGKRAAWVSGNNNRGAQHPYFWIRNANIVLTENGLGLEPRSNRKLSVILVRELNQIRVPGILTLRPKVSQDSVLAIAQIMDEGSDPPFRIGFRISEKILVSNFDNTSRMISAKRDGMFFDAQIDRLISGKTYYIRAYAENAAGLHFGSVRKIRVEKTYDAPFEASAVGGNWYKSEWFGAFMHGFGNWIFHNQLGWLYHGPVNGNGIWLWSEKTKWSWTRSDIWPYLWINDQANWLYFYESHSIQPTFWNFSDQSLFIW